MAITIPDNDAVIRATATGGQTVFNYDFPIKQASDLKVIKTPVSGGADVTLALTTDFTVTGVGVQAGGTMVLNSGATLNDKFTIYRDEAIERTSNFNNAGDLKAEVLNEQLNSIIRWGQQLERDLARAFKLALSSSLANLTLPIPSANNLVGWNATADALENKIIADTIGAVITPFIATLVDDNDAATARATLGAAKSGSNSDITALNVLANINGDQLGACKNKIINGSFDVWQGGAPLSASASGVYGPDQWRIEGDGAGWTKTFSKTGYGGPLDSAMPTRFYLTVAGTVAGSGATYSNLAQPIEGASSLHNGPVTLSYWLYSDRTFTQSILIRQNFGSGGSPSASVDVSTSVNVVAGWNKVEKTLTLADAINGKTYGTNGDDQLQVFIGLPINTTYSFAISNVQLERGSVASKFEVEPFAETLRKCQRYYQKTFPMATAPAQNAGVTGALTHRQLNVSSSNFGILWSFKTEMRATPTIITYNPSAANASFRNIDLGTDLTVAATIASPRDVSIEHHAVSMTANQRAQIHATANARY